MLAVVTLILPSAAGAMIWHHSAWANVIMYLLLSVDAAAADDDDDVDRVLFDALRSVAPFCWPTMLSI